MSGSISIEQQGVRGDRLHPAVVSPHMDSMRILSETAAAFPDALSLSSGAPHDEGYHLADLTRLISAYAARMESRGMSTTSVVRRMFHYGNVNGFAQGEIARMLEAHDGVSVDPRAIMVTNGFQEALLIALRGIFSGPDDVLLSVAPAYVGVFGAAAMLDIPVHPIVEGRHGIAPDDVRDAVIQVRNAGRRPVALYVVPDFSNPSGTVIPDRERRELLRLADEFDFLILEDNPYGIFARAGEERPTLKALDESQRVVFLGAFAKSAFPGARMGYLVADQRVTSEDGTTKFLAERLTSAKSMFTVGTSSLSQALIAEYLAENDFDLRSVVEPSRAAYLERLETAVDALRVEFPAGAPDSAGVTWNEPRGGFFLVLSVPFSVDLSDMEACARDYGVSWAPMRMFYPAGGGECALRLGVSNLSLDDIRESISRLAAYVRMRMERDEQ